MNMEALLTERIGDAGKRLHTARSRNDQVAAGLPPVSSRRKSPSLWRCSWTWIKALIRQAEANLDTVMPGYTHLQRAQPITFAHTMMAYANMFRRDITRLEDCRSPAGRVPLGSGALAATTYPDRPVPHSRSCWASRRPWTTPWTACPTGTSAIELPLAPAPS